METMKKWGLFVLILMLPLAFVACSDDDDDDSGSSSSIVGTWTAEIDDSYEEIEIEITFKADGTGKLFEYAYGESYKEEFEYKVKGNILTIYYYDDSYSGYDTVKYIFEIVGNKLYLYDEDDEDDLEMVLTRE